MENNKKNVGRIVIIVLLVIFILLAAGIAINMMRMRKTFMKLAEGSFVYRDGVETYMEHGQVVIDKLVNVDGKIYYVDNEGHKVKDTWAIIDNDGHYGYFGNFGDLVVNKIRTIDGKDYYFDENGILYQDKTEKQIKIIDGAEYIANKNGELRFASGTFASETETTTTAKAVTTTTARQQTQTTIISAEQVAAERAAAQQAAAQQAAAQQAAAQQAAAQQAAAQQAATQQAAAQQAATQQSVQISTAAPFANAINVSGSNTTVPDEFGGPGVVGNNTGTNTAQVSPGNTAQTAPVAPGGGTTTNAQSAKEVKIQSTQRMTETVDGDDYECNITIVKPIMVGTSSEETMNMNSCIDEVMDAILEDVQGVVGEYDTLPKSVSITNASISSSTNSRVVIQLSGSVRPKSGSSKSIKYRITYDRKEVNADFSRTTN